MTKHIIISVNEAKKLHRQFDEIDETNPILFDALYKMWRHVGYSDSSARKAIENRVAWSAAFISYLFRDYKDFPKSASHSNYIVQARDNTATSKGNFKLRRISEYRPKVGDIVCLNRGGNSFTYDTISRGVPTHCDIVTSVNNSSITTIGGNVSNEIETTEVPTINGFISKSGYFAIIQNEHYNKEFNYVGNIPNSLKRGDIGSNVKLLQNRLNSFAKKNMIVTIANDGIFGPKTEALLHLLTGRVSIALEELDRYFEKQQKNKLNAFYVALKSSNHVQNF